MKHSLMVVLLRCVFFGDQFGRIYEDTRDSDSERGA